MRQAQQTALLHAECFSLQLIPTKTDIPTTVGLELLLAIMMPSVVGLLSREESAGSSRWHIQSFSVNIMQFRMLELKNYLYLNKIHITEVVF